MPIVDLPLSELVLDFSLYPRTKVDPTHVREMWESFQAGVTFPEIIADTKSKRVIDGFHRVTMRKREDDPQVPIAVDLRSYRDDKAMFLEAMALNANHGRALCAFDKAHAIIQADRLGIADKSIARALAITVDRVTDLRNRKTATIGKLTTPIKRTIGHMAGKSLTKEQVIVNTRLGGMNQRFYCEQLIMLIESDLLDQQNTELMDALRKLGGLIDTIFAVA